MIQRESNTLRVSGRLTMDSIGSIFSDAMQALDGKDWTIDLARVDAADSAAVGLLLAWLRNAQHHQVRLNFVNVPDNLYSLAGLYGVADVLPLNHSSN